MMPESQKTLEDRFNTIGAEITDVNEETHDLFSHDLPQSNLGMVNDRTNILDIEIAGERYEIRQSIGLLTSSNAEGTTGAALWKISPLIAEWLADRSNILWTTRLLDAEATLVELGCGIAGLIGCVMARRVFRYVLTDQRSVLKLLQENIDVNVRKSASKVKGRNAKKQPVREYSTNVHALELNWETDDVAVLNPMIRQEETVDLVIVCDCVFNDFLLAPLVDVCERICSRPQDKPVGLLIAQQLRSDQVFSAFMALLMRKFRVWRLSDSVLSPQLHDGSGFAVHLALLR